MSWNGLPPELRRPILQIFAANNSSIAGYATINKEWQSAIEAETFRSLTITLDSIFEFTEHFSGQVHRQCSLKHLRLSIGIPPFDPLDSDWIVTSQPVGTTGEFSKAVSLLFAFLEEWDAPALLEKPDGGVRLEICLPFGPSDSMDVQEIQLPSGFTYFSSTKDGGRMSRGGLPVVKVITEFIFFDSNRCTIAPNTMFDIIVSLPNLARVYFERPYRTSATDNLIDQDNQSELARLLPMWPDSIKKIAIVQRDIGPRLNDPDRPECARFAAIVAGHSFKLEELAVCHYIDASDFFEETQRLQALQPQPWNNLLSLALTFDRVSAHIRPPWIVGGNPQGPDRFLNSLFHKAGEAAKLMPVLRTMNLLNCNYILNGDFKYEASNGNATVRWAGTWPIQLSDRVRQVWGEVAQQRNFRLQILSESIDDWKPCDSVFYSLSNQD